MTLLTGTSIFNGVGMLSDVKEQWRRRGNVLKMEVWGSLGYLDAVIVDDIGLGILYG